MKNTIEFEGEIYRLQYGIDALEFLMGHFDCGLDKAYEKLFNLNSKKNIKYLSIYLYAGLLKYQPKISIQKAKDIADIQVFRCIGAITKAVRMTLPKKEKSEEKEGETSNSKNG